MSRGLEVGLIWTTASDRFSTSDANESQSSWHGCRSELGRQLVDQIPQVFVAIGCFGTSWAGVGDGGRIAGHEVPAALGAACTRQSWRENHGLTAGVGDCLAPRLALLLGHGEPIVFGNGRRYLAADGRMV